jgi:phosphate transport system ATP-binding protein
MPTEQMTEPQEQATPPVSTRPDPPTTRIETRQAGKQPVSSAEPIFEVKEVGVSYNGNPAVRNITLDIGRNRITALIGPSGCGKSTLIRCFNRMNDLITGAKVDGSILYHGQDLYGTGVDPVEVRKLIGMVFQKPNPFPKSLYDNIAFGPRVIGMQGDMDAIVERALTRAALWNEVKDRLKENAYQLSGGQQQRLCIARCMAVEPDVILMDEPCSALDPIATAKIEDLMLELKDRYSIVIVTHNMQQAARVSDMTAVLMPEVREGDVTIGHIVEYAETDKIFTNPENKRTEEYVTGRVG